MWFPPPPSFNKLDFDGSVRNSYASAGVIISDSQGSLIKACAYNLGTAKVYIAEAMALQKGILLAIQEGISQLHIVGDNLLVINTVQVKWAPSRQIANIIKDIQHLLATFCHCNIQHIYKEVNKAIDWIAKVDHLINSSFVIENCSNSTLHSIIVNDILGIPFMWMVS